MSRKKLLVTGASGFLGWNICRLAQERWNVAGTSFTHEICLEGIAGARVDLTSRSELGRFFDALQPDAVVHAAAASDPNYCQAHPELSMAVNVRASLHLARLCARRAIPYVFISTDLVFDGDNAPYSEMSPVNPLSLYGAQKAEAERGIAAIDAQALVCRMPLMFGDAPPAAKSFIQPMIRSMRQGEEIALFTDEFRSPVSALDAALGVLQCIGEARGLLHLGGKARLSRYEFGEALGNALGIARPPIRRALQGDFPMSAPRPRDVSLDSSKAFSLGYDPDVPRDALEKLFCVTGGKAALNANTSGDGLAPAAAPPR